MQGERLWREGERLWRERRKTLERKEKDSGEKEKDSGEKEKDSGEKEKDSGEKEKDSGEKEKDSGEKEKDSGEKEKDSGEKEKDSGEKGERLWRERRKTLERRRKTLERRRKTLERKEKDSGEKGERLWRERRKTLERKEKDSGEKEKDSGEKEKDSGEKEKDSGEKEKDSGEKEKDSGEKEKDSGEKGERLWRERRKTLERKEKDSGEKEKDSGEKEKDSGEKGERLWREGERLWREGERLWRERRKTLERRRKTLERRRKTLERKEKDSGEKEKDSGEKGERLWRERRKTLERKEKDSGEKEKDSGEKGERLWRERRKTLERRRKTLERRRKTLERKEKDSGEKEKDSGEKGERLWRERRKTLERRRKTLERRRKTLERRRKTLERRRKTLERRRKTLERRRKTLERRRKTLERRRKTLERKEKDSGEKEKDSGEKEKDSGEKEKDSGEKGERLWRERRKTLERKEKDSGEKEKDSGEKEKDSGEKGERLWREGERLWREGERLWRERRKTLERKEKDSGEKEKDSGEKEKDSGEKGERLWREGETLWREGERLWREGERLWREGERLWRERRKTLERKEKDSGEKEKDSGEKEKDSGEKEKDSGEKEKDSGEKEKDSGEKEKDSGEKEKDSGEKEKDSGEKSNIKKQIMLRASNGAAPNAVHYSTNNNNGNFAPKFLPETKTRRQPYGRSASSSRRQGVVFTSLSSPDSSDESSPLVARLSRFGEPSPARSLGQRDRSAPSKQRNYVGSGGPPVSSMLLRREVPSAAEYLFPNRVSLSRVSTPTPSFTTPPAPSSSSSPFSVRAAPFMTPPLERRLFSANYRTHAAEASPSNSLARHRQGTQMNSAPRHTSHPYHNGETQIDSQTYQDVGISAAPFFLASPLLNVETLAVSDDERSPGRLEGCAHRRDSGVGSSLSRSPSAPSTLRLRQSMLTPPSPLSSSFSSSTSSSTASWPNHHIHSSTGGSIIDVVVSGRKRPTLPSVSLSSLKESSSSDCFFSDSQLSHVVDGLSVMEIGKLRKRAYLRLSLLLEKYCNQPLISLNSEPDSAANFSAKNWTMQKFFKKMKNVEAKQMKEEGIVFGQTLDSIRQRSGHCLPRTILEILRYLRQIAPDTVGIFRKNGVKSRIAELRLLCDRETDTDLFVEENALTSAQVHDVADLLKQYLRELPEPLMTTKYSRTFANIHEYVPEEGRINATRDALLLLPDEHREALQTLLFFLADIAKHSSTNSMPAQNLSVCLTPSLFHLSASRLQTASPASRRHKTVGGTGMPSEAEMRETRAAQACLTTLITHATALFTLSNTARDATHAHTDIETPLLKSLGGQKGPRAYLQKKMEELVREHGERWRGWIVEGHSEGVELSSKGSYDEHPLQLFRAWTDVDAPPKEVLHRITRERYVWDSNLLNSRVMDSLLPDTELYQFVVNDSVGHPTRDCFVIRMQRTDMVEPRGAACLVERSVACSETQLLGGVGAAVLDSRYLIEPHQGRSRITLISRIDLRGRGPAWYTTHYHYILARQLKRLRLSFQQPADDGPETKV